MRRIFCFFTCVLFLCITSCRNSGPQGGIKYSPKERQSPMTEEQRLKAIEEKRARLASVDLDIKTLLFDDNIKLTVLPPEPNGDLTMEGSVNMMTKMLQISAAHGIGGFGTSPSFVFAAAMSQTKRAATGGVPQRMVVSYEITFFVANMINGDVYALLKQEVSGVGSSFIDATSAAIGSITDTPGMQQMLEQAKVRITRWYNEEPGQFKAAAEKLIAEHEYAAAYALLESVPSSARECHRYATGKLPTVSRLMEVQMAEETLANMRDAIAEAGIRYSPKVAAYMSMLPVGSSQMKEAKGLFDEYSNNVRKAQSDSLSHVRKVELENIEKEKLRIQYAQKASLNTINRLGSSKSGSMFGVGKHPFLWALGGLGVGAILGGGLGLGLGVTGLIRAYSSLPLLGRIGLAFL